MNTLTLIFVSLCIFAIGYRFYGIVFVSSFKKWYELAKIKSLTTDKYGDLVKAVVEE